jgi:hypothetical protein
MGMRFNKLTSRLLFIASLSLVSIIGFSQINIAVAPVKMNVLYIGVDNPLSVAASGAVDDKVTITIVGGGGAVSKVDAGMYNVKVTTQTNDCTVNVYVDGNLAGSTKFRVRMLPQPHGTVGGFTSGAYVDANIFRSKAGIGLYVENSLFEVKYEVIGFKLILPDEKGATKTVDCDGNVFSPEAKQYLNQYLKRGDIVTVENIRVKGPNGSDFKLPALLYNIK